MPNLKAEIARFASMASVSLVKDKRVNIRISSRDLEDIQAKAAEEAIPYQTLMASVLHKFVTGRLVESSPSLAPRSLTQTLTLQQNPESRHDPRHGAADMPEGRG